MLLFFLYVHYGEKTSSPVWSGELAVIMKKKFYSVVRMPRAVSRAVKRE